MKRPANFKDKEFNDKHLVIVTWGDAYANLSYYDTHGGQDTTPMISKDVGWICEENDDCIVLVSSVSETGSQRNMSVIPNCNIISIEELDFV